VPIYAIGLHDGRPCFTMPLVLGGTLAQHLERYHRDLRAAVGLLEKVARAVQVAHEAGVIHRDLKPGNILLDGSEPLVADFGLAKLADSDVSRSGDVFGTPAYMSPEQALGRPVSAASDVWALGVILFEVLTGKRPFEGRGLDAALAAQTEPPPRPRRLRRDLPVALEQIILKCLAKDPAERYASAGALADDLGRWLRGESVLAEPAPGPAQPRWRAVASAGAFLGLLGLAAALLGLSSPPGPESEAPDALARLRKGQAVTLIGKTGGPARLHWLTTAGIVTDAPFTEGAFTFDSMLQFATVELLPSVPLESYRLRAQIRHLDGEGRVGLFVLHGPNGVREHIHLDLTLNDGVNPNDRQIGLKYRRFANPDAQGSRNDLSPPPLLNMPTPAPRVGEKRKWHDVAIEVRPTGVRALLNGKPLQSWTAKELQSRRKSLFLGATAPATLPPYPQGGVGLLVYRAGGSFREVVLEPLPDNPDPAR
jgi:serine/threonine-protein kinase